VAIRPQVPHPWPRVSLNIYSITENIYYSQLSYVALLIRPEPNSITSYSTRKGLGSLFICAIVLRSPSPSHVFTSIGQRSSEYILRPLYSKQATGWTTSGSIPGKAIFSSPQRRDPPGATSLLTSGYRGRFLASKSEGRECDCLPRLSAAECVEIYLHCPHTFAWRGA
jgi:hypothetical protein